MFSERPGRLHFIPLVIGIWGLLLVLATALLAGMGGRMIEVVVYIGVFALFIAALVISRRRKRLRTGPWRATPGGGTMLLLAIGAVIAGFGLAFGWWIRVCSAPFFATAIVHEIYAQRKRVSPG
jgi:hypothetical protein